MIEVAKIINLIANTSSYNDKQYLLKKNENVPGLKKILKFIYDPYVRTGISKAKLAKASLMLDSVSSTPVDYEQMINYLLKHRT